MKIVSTTGLTKHYGTHPAVEALSLELDEGQIFGFLGPNGAGKTTTIRLLLGLLRPSEGRARIFGLDCWRQSARIKAEVGYLPGDLRLYSWLTARRALRLFGRVRGRELLGRGLELSEVFGLDPELRVSRMSRGTRQKLGLVLALAHRPRLVVLDEPTASLDPVMQDRLKEELKEMARAGHTVFFSSHMLSEVEQLCDRVAILREGRLVTNSTLRELQNTVGRQVEIRWGGGSRPEPEHAPAGLVLIEEAERHWKCELRGSPAQLLGWLAEHDVEDLLIAAPDLETLFQRFYGE